MANIKRIRELFKYIEKNTKKKGSTKHFNMVEWVKEIGPGHTNSHTDFYNETTDAYEQFSCGTNMCLAGWAVTKAGGSFIKLHNWSDPLVLAKGSILDTSSLEDEVRGLPGVSEFVADYLGLDAEDAHQIFTETGNPKDLEWMKSKVNMVLGEVVFPEAEPW